MASSLPGQSLPHPRATGRSAEMKAGTRKGDVWAGGPFTITVRAFIEDSGTTVLHCHALILYRRVGSFPWTLSGLVPRRHVGLTA